METYYIEIKSTPEILIAHTKRDGGQGIFIGGGGVIIEMMEAALAKANVVWQRQIKFGYAYIAEFGAESLAALKSVAEGWHSDMIHPARQDVICQAESFTAIFSAFEDSKMHWPLPSGTIRQQEMVWRDGGFVKVTVIRRRPANPQLLPEQWEVISE